MSFSALGRRTQRRSHKPIPRFNSWRKAGGEKRLRALMGES